MLYGLNEEEGASVVARKAIVEIQRKEDALVSLMAQWYCVIKEYQLKLISRSFSVTIPTFCIMELTRLDMCSTSFWKVWAGNAAIA